jgi:hypothetical protein
MLLLYALLYFSAVMLTLIVAHMKLKRIKTLIHKHNEKEKSKSKEIEASKEGNDKINSAN